MWNIYKTVGVLTVICVLFGLYFSAKSPTSATETAPSNAINETKSVPPAEAQVAPTVAGQDPFKKFLDQKPSNSSTALKSENTQPSPVQPGKDPFKEFLETQKQNSKDQVVSPFGKN